MFREQTEEEKRDFIAITTSSGAPVKTAEEVFRGLIADKQQEAMKKGLPFASKAVMDLWVSHYTAEKSRITNKLGYFDPSQVKQLNVDWDKYSDLKNFDVIEESERYDDHLSKRHNELVYIKYKTYQYKGYYHKYTVMEDGILALQRIKRERLATEAKAVK